MYSLWFLGWPSLTITRKQHLYIFLYKTIMCKLPVYLCVRVSIVNQLRSSEKFPFDVHKVRDKSEENSIFLLCTLDTLETFTENFLNMPHSPGEFNAYK